MIRVSYGRVGMSESIVRFDRNIQSKTSQGTKINVFVHEFVFDSDEAIVQILYHEMHEIEELRYAAKVGISLQAYNHMVRADRKDNLHYQAVIASDTLLLAYRRLLKQGVLK